MYVSWKNVVKLSDAEIGSAQNTVVVKKQGQVTNSNLEETSYYYSTISIQLYDNSCGISLALVY